MGKSVIKDTINVMFSNCVFLLSSVVTGFIIPMLLGATNYGYYKIFMLYATYTALLHFGFADGVLILNGGQKYLNLDKKQFRTNTNFYFYFQFIIAVILSAISLFVNSHFFKILFLSLGIYTFLQNIVTYYQFISQAVMKFNQYSFSRIMQAILTIVSVLILYISYRVHLIQRPGFVSYIFVTIFIIFCLFVWYIYKYKDVTFGCRYNIFKKFYVIKRYFSSGIYVTISYQVSNLLLNLDNQFISWFFSVYTYGVYAFAYSLISVINTVLSAISTVLLPYLEKQSKNYILKKYSNVIAYVLLIVFLFMSGYFPLTLIVKFLLSKYIGSLIYFRILIPGVALNCCITLVIFNYYNALGKSKFNFIINICILVISSIIYLLCYYVFKSSIALAFGSLIVLLLWFILLEVPLIIQYHVKWIKNIIYIIVVFIDFWVISFTNNVVIGCVLYLISYSLISLFIFRDLIKKNYKALINRFKF